VTDADIAHEVLVDRAAAFKKSAGLQFLKPMLGEGLPRRRHAAQEASQAVIAAFAPKRLAEHRL